MRQLGSPHPVLAGHGLEPPLLALGGMLLGHQPGWPNVRNCALCTSLPRVQRLWTDYFLHYNFSTWLTPTTPLPATAIDNTEPWTEVCLLASV